MKYLVQHLESVIRRCGYIAFMVCVGFLFLIPSAVYAIDVEEVIWGFENQQSQGECIPLSILLSNNTPEVFDEPVQLNRLQYNRNKVGAPLYRRIYLAPYTSQWVQFYPYIISGYQEDWSLNWGPGNLSSRRISKPGKQPGTETKADDRTSRIIITSPNSLTQGGSHFKRFSEELFPPSVTATDTLDEVILDHVPRWGAARRTSFMDWLYRGGVLHLLPGVNEQNLVFTSDLSALNAPVDHFRIGAGQVIRHQGNLKDLDDKALLAKKRKVEIAELNGIGVPVDANKKKLKPVQNTNYNNYQGMEAINRSVLHRLSEMTRPEHNWSMIYMLTGAYLLMIYPGCALFGRKKKGYRRPLLFLLVAVALFSTLFWSVGKRGYGETTTMNNLIIARPVNGDYYDLTYCTNAFVTDGGGYQFVANGTGSIFTTAQEVEKVRGAIVNGVDGKFQSDIPPFSARSFMCRIKSPFPKPDIQVLDYQIDKKATLKSLKIELKSPLPKDTTIIQVLYGRVLYDLTQRQQADSTILELLKRRTPLSAWQTTLDHNSSYSRSYGYREEDADVSKVYNDLYKSLVFKNLNLVRPEQLRAFDASGSQIKLFFYSDMPDEFKLKTDVVGIQQGRTLFVNEIVLPEKKND